MKKEDILALNEFREMYGDEAADALVQYLTKKRKDLTAREVLEDDGAFERFSNWAYTKLHVDVYEKFAKNDIGGFFKRTNVEDFRKMRPGVSSNYNYFLKDFGESIIKENDKITLTFGQLKKLVREFREKIVENDDYDDEEYEEYEICNKCGREVDPCDAYYVSSDEAYCSEECLEDSGHTLDDVIDDTEIDKSYESKIGEELEDKDISKVYDELKKTGKKDDEIGKVIGGMMTSNESVKYFSRQKMFGESTLDTPAYWNNNGKHQDLADRVSGVSVDDLIAKFKIPYSIASKFDRDRFQYFRFFNDGDMPTIFKRDIIDKFGEFPKYCDMNDDELFNFVAQRLEALIDADLNMLKPFLDKVPEDDNSIEETVVLKKQLIIGDNNDGTITLMMTVRPSEDDKKMLRMLAGDESIDFKKDPEYSYWYATIKGKTPKEAEEQISSNFQDYAIEIDNDQDQISL